MMWGLGWRLVGQKLTSRPAESWDRDQLDHHRHDGALGTLIQYYTEDIFIVDICISLINNYMFYIKGGGCPTIKEGS